MIHLGVSHFLIFIFQTYEGENPSEVNPNYTRFTYLIDSQGDVYKDTRMDTIWAFRKA